MKSLALLILLFSLPALAHPAQPANQMAATPPGCIAYDRQGASPHNKACIHIRY